MSDRGIRDTQRPQVDSLVAEIADYVSNFSVTSKLAYETARYCLMDAIGCALLASQYPACCKLLGPVVPGAVLPGGARVPGTSYELDPVRAAFNIGTMIRWLDFNDTWLAAEWGHPSDNLGGILAVSDYLSRQNVAQGKSPVLIRDVLTAMIKAYEIQGVIALDNSFNRVGLDHVLLVRIASTAVTTFLLGGSQQQVINAVTNAWADGGCLRAYRHAPNTGSRKSWAAGDASSRAVQLALMAMQDEMGYPSILSAKNWGFHEVLFKGNVIRIGQPFSSYVMDNILFKISFPAEFHAQTAVEAAIKLHPIIKHSLEDIEKIVVHTQEAAMRIIDKTGVLNNPADRDHCLQYMVAIGLIFGNLTAADYEDNVASDVRIDQLREKMQVLESRQFSEDYLDPKKRSIANSIQIYFCDGSSTEIITVDYPLGHKRRRKEGIPLLKNKFIRNLGVRITADNRAKIQNIFSEQSAIENTPVHELMDMLIPIS